MKKKLKLNKLTVANLERVKGGFDPVCLCPVPPIGARDEAYYHIGPATTIIVKTACCLTGNNC